MSSLAPAQPPIRHSASPQDQTLSTVNIAVIGCGYWGPNLIRNLANTPGARLVAVCDLQQDRLAKLRASYPGVDLTTDFDSLIQRKDIHAVAIATPVASHYSLAKKALAAGMHVLLEKPMTSTVAEAQELIALAEVRQRVLMVDHTFIYTGAVQKIRDLVQTQELGELLYYDSVRINLGLFRPDVDVLWDLAVHDLAIMDFALGQEPVAVSATGHAHFRGQLEDIAYLTCFFESNLIAHLHVNWLAPVKIRRTIIGGSRQMVVYDDLEPSEKLKIYDRGASIKSDEFETLRRQQIDYRMGGMHAPHIPQDEALRANAAHFIDCINQSRTPLTDGQTGLRIVRILEAASLSMKRRGEPVALHR